MHRVVVSLNDLEFDRLAELARRQERPTKAQLLRLLRVAIRAETDAETDRLLLDMDEAESPACAGRLALR